MLATGCYSRTLPGLEIGGADHHQHGGPPAGLGAAADRVLGGGVIGVEFASVFKSFGTEVTIVEALPRLVPNEDEFASKLLERAFRKRKITFKTGVRFTAAKQTDDAVTVSLEAGEDIEADLLLVAVGRGPNTTGHGYEEAGVTMERGFVLTDERCAPTCRTSTPSATSCPACSWPTAASSRASSWPRTSPGSTRR